MNEQINNQKEQKLIQDLSTEIYNMSNNYEVKAKSDFIFEHSNDMFKKLCTKAKLSYELASDNFDKEKLCYMIAVYVLKSGLYYILEKAYQNGFDFDDM